MPEETPIVAPATQQQSETFSKDYVRELREENKNWRLKATELEKERDTHKTASERAAQESEERVKTALQTASDRVLCAKLQTAALKAGMVDLDGLKLADLSKVKLSDDDEVEGADALMEEMKKSKPYLFGVKTDTSTPNNPPNPKKPEAKNAKDMTDEEYEQSKRDMLRGSKRR